MSERNGTPCRVPKAHLGGAGRGHREVLTHGLQLPDEFLLCPLRPLLLVGVDGAEDGPTGLATVLDGRHIQVVHQDDVRVLWGEQTLAT